MKISQKFVAALLCTVPFVGSASANEIYATVIEGARGKTSIAFDIESNGGVEGFSFKVNIPGLVDSGHNLSRCVNELPAGFQGACSVVNGQLLVYAISNRMGVGLPAGVASVGRVDLAVDASFQKGRSEYTITEIALGSGSAQELPATAKISVEPLRGLGRDSRQEK